MSNWDNWDALIKHEKEVNQAGRPEPDDYVNKEAVSLMLEDSRGLTKTLFDNRLKWDANKDGFVAPSELEDIFTNPEIPTDERTAAAAVRKAYQVFADLDVALPFGLDSATKAKVAGGGSGFFIDPCDFVGMALSLSGSREAAVDLLQKAEDREHDRVLRRLDNKSDNLLWLGFARLVSNIVLWDHGRNLIPQAVDKFFDEKDPHLNSLRTAAENQNLGHEFCVDDSAKDCIY